MPVKGKALNQGWKLEGAMPVKGKALSLGWERLSKRQKEAVGQRQFKPPEAGEGSGEGQG
jgi:hypothetical protein